MGADPAQPEGARPAAARGDPQRIISALVFSAVVLFLTSIALLAVVMALGPPAERIGPGGPIWSLNIRTSPALIVEGERTGLILGALAVAIGIAAVGRGWRPSAKALIGAGAVVVALFIFLPPAGSTDVLDYAVYGRIAALGHNPYVMTPAQLYRSGDPVGLLAPKDWGLGPTAYGPVATALEWAAARLGGASMARIVFWIKLSYGIAFVATSLGLVRLAGRDRARQARACLLWAVNPLMLFWLVGSGHVDVLLALLAVAALITIRTRYGSGIVMGAVTGLIVGAATAIKTPFALAGVGLAWAARTSPRTIVAGLFGAAAVVIPSYLLPGVLNAVLFSHRLTVPVGFVAHVPDAIRSRPAVFSAMVLLATLALALLLLWRLPAGYPELPAVRPTAALAFAYVLLFPLQAPWYDALIFPLFALMPPSRLDYLLIARCLILSGSIVEAGQLNTGSLSQVISRFSNAGVLILFVVLIVMCLLRAWGATSPDGGGEVAAIAD